jgi:hypothetical protein
MNETKSMIQPLIKKTKSSSGAVEKDGKHNRRNKCIN